VTGSLLPLLFMELSEVFASVGARDADCAPRKANSWAMLTGMIALGSRLKRFLATALLIAGSASLAGCSSGMMADHLLPKGTPSRPATPAAYPAVNDPPTPRAERVLTEEEQKKLEDDLMKSRKRAQDVAKPGTAGNR
jgi:hypothetical protein